MRIFTASLATETNTFSPVPTDRASFEMAFYAVPGKHPDTPTLCSSPIVALRKRAATEGLTVIEGTATWAEPGGLLQKQAFEELRDEILDQLKAAMPVDAVVLGLHGAMVAQGYDDCEGDLLERVRAIVGPDILVASEFDPHSHLTQKRVENLNIYAAFLEFPHTDFYERGEHVVSMALDTLKGKIQPVISTFDCRMIGVFPTSKEPMRSFIDRIKAMHGKDGILSISVIHGFMAADVPEMGTRILVVTDNDRAKGDALAEKLGRELIGMREQTLMTMYNIDDGIDRAIAAHTVNPAKPAVIADVWDNPGGGVAGDGTHILRRLIERNIQKAAVATIWDTLAVTFCHAAGEGAVIDLRIGGKSGPQAGEPIDARVTVMKVLPEGWQSFGLSRVTLGPSAVVRIEGTEIDVILNTNRTQTFEPDIFSNIGIDPMLKDILVVKSTNHFHAGFAPIAAEIIYVDAPSSYPVNPRATNYQKMTRPIWPRVDNPW
ncbi:microcystin LR degradation protein MlrC-like protein [Ochrobactrum sp. MYb15]|uniref:M81 family metallopeptidase n=1 Tax=Brucella TaxID=234 RepID=UPI00046305FB|nr:M81 family metallopeptidase [Brucella rhizosphaerae]PQZ50262.1 microcystin LR degradation protein MlrC-like protein [Ochrobactrum sp. MYb19]PRA55228.1 microcystin LR degradation protein MlrC-like protein [Ochrobactrum sp. MYb68]PRA68303.1 microcystin LR degradation protein MlrC-like protein [Ochrobactrum sp. MYb18]PRA74469.1 microcystin LR degradation protein MlrC-like protein [Brucella thiophenivorans]PRA90553.1 microcystin LR degradation protein MlrC-like protein [Ochrobactrum sp. MYb14]